MIIFLTEALYNRVYNELALKQSIPKWIGTKNLREYFKQIEPNIKFDGTVLSPTETYPQSNKIYKCGVEISDSIFQELIDSSKYDYSIFWRVFSSFAETTDKSFKPSLLQEGLFYNYISSQDEPVTVSMIDKIIDYIDLKFDMVNTKLSDDTIYKIFNGTHKRYRHNQYYGKWKYVCDKNYMTVFNKIDIWLECNSLESSNVNWVFDDVDKEGTPLLQIINTFLNKVKLLCY